MTFVERLTLLSSAAALISSLAALATAIAQIFISRASSLSAYRLETSKLYFQAKTQAYLAFFSAAQEFLGLSSQANAAVLMSRCSGALLFSEAGACTALSHLSNVLLKFQQDPSGQSPAELSAAQTAAVEAMRQELLLLRDPFAHRFGQYKRRVHTAHKD